MNQVIWNMWIFEFGTIKKRYCPWKNIRRIMVKFYYKKTVKYRRIFPMDKPSDKIHRHLHRILPTEYNPSIFSTDFWRISRRNYPWSFPTEMPSDTYRKNADGLIYGYSVGKSIGMSWREATRIVTDRVIHQYFKARSVQEYYWWIIRRYVMTGSTWEFYRLIIHRYLNFIGGIFPALWQRITDR